MIFLSVFILQIGKIRGEKRSRERRDHGATHMAILPGDEAKWSLNLEDELLNQPVLYYVTDNFGIGSQIHLLQQAGAVGADGFCTQ